MKKLQLLLLAAIVFVNANAQKLPAVQKVSVQAPANIKIDGKATEWGDKFEAYNPASRVFYTLSNDKDNLYLVARMEDKYGNQKAILGGITFSILPKKNNRSVSKTIAVTFPVADGKKKDALFDLVDLAKNFKGDAAKTDSLRKVINKTIGASFKEIEVTGIKEIDDESIPIYNAQGIQLAANVDDQIQFVLEAALPLKYLKDLIDSTGKILYDIKINGTILTKPGTSSLVIRNPQNLPASSLYTLYATDFAGEYMLAK